MTSHLVGPVGAKRPVPGRSRPRNLRGIEFLQSTAGDSGHSRWAFVASSLDCPVVYFDRLFSVQRPLMAVS